ncbi:twin-arginine translocation signal domain-containing protein, partial [Acetobacter oeni]
MTLSRRNFLRNATVLAGIAGLAACTATTTNGVTTITLNVTKVKDYGQAGLNAAATVAGFLAAYPALSPYMAAITVADTALSGALTAFSDAAGSTLTITYNNADWKTRVDSILSDLNTVATQIAAAISGGGAVLGTTIQTDAQTALSALKTIISVFEGLIGVSGARAATIPTM